MASHLFLSPTTDASIAHLTARLLALRKKQHLAPGSILLPSASVIHDVRNRLGNAMGVQMYQFYGLGNAVLDEAGIPIQSIQDASIRRLLRHILQEMHTEGLLTSFAPLWEKPGFLEVLLDWIREMKSQGIFPEAYASYAEGQAEERDRQLAEIYLRYQAFMQTRNYSDPDGLLWVAEEALAAHPQLFCREDPLFILGFDQFTPVQIRILRQLSSRFSDLNIYLLWDENRTGESLALARLQRTRTELLARMTLEVSSLPEETSPNPLLGHLQHQIFETGEPRPADERSLQLIEAPSREAEVRWALRKIKQLLIAGVAPSKMAILTPNQNAYASIVRTVSIEYGVPIELDQPLRHNPAVAALVNLLGLPPDYAWQPIFEALRSPYVRQPWLSETQVELLDQLSRERPVIAGREQWSFALQPLVWGALDREDEDLGPPPLAATLDPEILAAVEEGMTAFLDHISPPPSATYRAYTWWLQTAIIGYFPTDAQEEEAAEPTPSLDLIGACLESPFQQRDFWALDLVMQALRRLLASAEIVPVEVEIPWEKYRDDLFTLLRVIQIPPDPFQKKVRFERLEGGRARTVDCLFVLGLSEGEFPAPPAADPLYAPGERESHPLPLIRYSPANDASLWWQVVSSVKGQLFLLRPYIDENGAPWQASPYWDAVQACFTNLPLERLPIAEPPLPEQATSQTELLVALVRGGAWTVPAPLGERWAYIQQAEKIFSLRHSYLPPGEYEGIIRSRALKNDLAAWFGEGHIWSASRLNRYANCPYGFFAEHILKLQSRPDPEEGLDAMQRGSLLHAILEALYQRLSAANLTPTIENQETILEQLAASCAQLFPSAPRRYGFRPGALWTYEQQELHRLLRALVSWECQENGFQARFAPFLQEAGFGLAAEESPVLDVWGDQAHFRLRGVIDRLDRDAAGNLRVIDYKSGSTTYSKNDLQKGLALQTALYALAAEQFWAGAGSRVAESHYWHIPSRKASGSLKIAGAVLDDEVADVAIQQASRSVAQVRAGLFPSAPRKPQPGSMQCSSRCDFAPLCRVTRQSIAKARRGGLA